MFYHFLFVSFSTMKYNNIAYVPRITAHLNGFVFFLFNCLIKPPTCLFLLYSRPKWFFFFIFFFLIIRLPIEIPNSKLITFSIGLKFILILFHFYNGCCSFIVYNDNSQFFSLFEFIFFLLIKHV